MELSDHDYLTSQLLYNRGVLAQKMNKYAEAIKDYNSCLEINPNYTKAYFNRALCKKLYLKDFKGALKDLHTAVKINPDDPEAYFSIGNTLSDLGKEKEAIEYYDKAIQLDPKHVKTYMNRGVSKMNVEDFKGAKKDFDMVSKLNKSSKK